MNDISNQNGRSFKTAFIIIVFIVLGIFGYWLYHQIVVVPNKRIETQQKQITELNKTIEELKVNATLVTKTEIKKGNGWTWFFMFTTFLFFLLWILAKSQKPDLKNRHEIIEFLREYALKYDGVKLYKQIHFIAGYYKADELYPLALCTFSTLKSWDADIDPRKDPNIEPPKQYHFGYLVSMKNPEDVREDFKGFTLKEMIKSINDTGYGLRGTHYAPYKTRSPEERALESFYKEQLDINKIAKKNKAVGEAMEDMDYE